jgi:hypothetical protein
LCPGDRWCGGPYPQPLRGATIGFADIIPRARGRGALDAASGKLKCRESTRMKLGRYRHYKGKEYEVLRVVMHTETHEKLVLYRALYEIPELRDEYGDDPWFVRPFTMFIESVVVDGRSMPRFEYLGEP